MSQEALSGHTCKSSFLPSVYPWCAHRHSQRGGVGRAWAVPGGAHRDAGHLSVLEPAGRDAGHAPHQAGIPGELCSGQQAGAHLTQLSMLGCPGVFVPALHVTHRGRQAAAR